MTHAYNAYMSLLKVFVLICAHASLSHANETSAATSGVEWQATHIRSFDDAGKMLATIEDAYNTRVQRKQHITTDTDTEAACCKKWIVLTTIFEPSKALDELLQHIDRSSSPLTSKWCVVVVGDTRTPEHAYVNLEKQYSGVMHFLGIERQKALWYRTAKHIGWNTFARKNVGYLFAIDHCANVVYDMDDDNVVIDEMHSLDRFSPIIASRSVMTEHRRNHSHHQHLFNPYVHFNNTATAAPGASIWPRGFPLDVIQSHTLLTKHRHIHHAVVHRHLRNQAHDAIDDSVALLQSIADVNPDVDAIYRLVQRLPVHFHRRSDDKNTVVLSLDTYAPLNAQALLVRRRDAMFGLLLPASVHGRVTDIWRSYVWQRILHEIGMKVAFSEPWVTHERHVHNYMRDFQAELPLYERAGALIDYLRAFDCGNDTLHGMSCFFKVYVALFEIGVVDRSDVVLAHAWILDLIDAGIADTDDDNASSASLVFPSSSPSSPPLLFIYILSHHSQKALRDAVRETWLQWLPDDGSVQYLFCIDEWTEASRHESAQNNGDIMALGTKALGWGKKFLDKFVRMLAHFLGSGSPRARHFLRLDTDAFLNLPLLVANLRDGAFPSKTIYSGKTHHIEKCKTGNDMYYNTRVDECYLLLSADAADAIYAQQKKSPIQQDFAGLGVGMLAYKVSHYQAPLSPINEHRYMHTTKNKQLATTKHFPLCEVHVARNFQDSIVIHPIKDANTYRRVYANVDTSAAVANAPSSSSPNCTCSDMVNRHIHCNNEAFSSTHCIL